MVAASPRSLAQDYTYLLLVDYGPGESSVHPGNPSATVRVWATMRTSDYAWANGNLDLVAGEAGWTAFELVLGFEGQFGRTRGSLSTDMTSVLGILTGQFNDAVSQAKTDHPILIWEGMWANLSEDYTPREVTLATSNTLTYRVFEGSFGASTQKIAEFVPGVGGINITPSPGAALVSAAWLLLAFRRRRAHSVMAARRSSQRELHPGRPVGDAG